MNTDIQKDTGLRTPEGVAEDVWLRLAERTDDRWVVRERSSQGEIVGEAHRFADGSKGFAKGGKRGLIVDWPLDAYAGGSFAGPVFVCEGASDTASALSVGLDAVGIPMAGACAADMADLLADRHAVVIVDFDEAGERGARKLLSALVPVCASVRMILPPLDAKDTREAVANGATRADFEALAARAEVLEIGSLVSTGALDASGESQTPARTFDWLSLDELGPGEMPRWVWPGCVARGGITLMTGLWKAGKTTMILHLLRDLYKGTGMVTEPATGPTLIVSEEGPASWAARRAEFELDGRIRYLARDTFARLTKDEWPRLVENIVRTTRELGAELVVIDTLANLWPVISENDAAEVLDALAPLRDITQAGAGLLLLHHPRKGDAAGASFTASRGSGALPAFADILIELRRYDNTNPQDTRRLIHAVGRFEDIPPERVFELTDEGYAELGEREVQSSLTQTDRLAAIIESGEGLTTDEVRSRWTGPRLGRVKLMALLNEGFTQGRWQRLGTGQKGSPWRYHAKTETHEPPADSPNPEPGALTHL